MTQTPARKSPSPASTRQYSFRHHLKHQDMLSLSTHLYTDRRKKGKRMGWIPKQDVKVQPEGGDPGKAEGDLDSVLLLLGQPVGVRVGEMGSHILSRYSQAATNISVNFSRFQRVSAFPTKIGRAWGAIVPRCPHPPPPPPLATRAALSAASILTHTGQVVSCVLWPAPGVIIKHKCYLKYFEVSSSCVHLNQLSLSPTSRNVLFIHKPYPEMNVFSKHVQSAICMTGPPLTFYNDGVLKANFHILVLEIQAKE